MPGVIKTYDAMKFKYDTEINLKDTNKVSLHFCNSAADGKTKVEVPCDEGQFPSECFNAGHVGFDWLSLDQESEPDCVQRI